MPTAPPTLRQIPSEIAELFDRALGLSRDQVESLFLQATDKVAKAWDMDDISRALTSHGDLEDFFGREGAAGLDEFRKVFREVYDGMMDKAGRRRRETAPLLETFVSASDAASQRSPIPAAWWSQSRITDEAVRWIDTEGLKRVVGITDASRDGMRAIVKEAFSVAGKGEAGIKRALLAMDGTNGPRFGLSPGGATSYSRWIDKNITEKGITGTRAKKMMDRRFEQLRRQRAGLIAHSESVAAANAGQVLTYELAAKEGRLDTDKYVLEWVARLIRCPRCAAFDGSTREMTGGHFVSDGSGPKGVESAAMPEIHAGGWCFTRSIRRAEALQRLDGKRGA